MDEIEIKMLEANGYNYIHGGIVDAEGNYLSSLELKGQILNSESEEDLFNENIALDREVQNQTDPIQEIKEYENDPINSVLSPEAKNYYPSYAEVQKENEIPTYDNVEDFQQYEEEKAIQKDLEDNLDTPGNLHTKSVFNNLKQDTFYDEAGINFNILEEIAPNEKRTKEIEAVDADIDTQVSNTQKNVDKNIGAMEDYLGHSNWLYDAVGLTIKTYAEIIKALSPDGAGMGDKELKKEYVELTERRKEILKPEIEKITGALEKELEFYDKDKKENYSSVGSLFGREEQDINNYTRRKLQKKVDYLKAYTEDSNLYNLLSEDFLSDAATFGLREGHDAVKYRHYLSSKINAGEELTPTEQRAAENLGRTDLLDGLNLEQNVLYNLTYGAGHSATYLGGGIAGKAVGKGVGKAVSKGVV